MARRWTGVLARTGVPTGDGRILDPAGMSFRELPVPLMWQEKTSEGHGGAVTVGSIDRVTMANGMILGEGRLLDLFPDRERLIELIDNRVVGPSVDLADDVEYVMDAEERIVITQAGIGGATLVPIEAFSDVSIEMVTELDQEVSETVDGPMDDEYAGLFASAAPRQLPPLEWFQPPDLDRLTPLVVSTASNGLQRVFGHMAGKDTCHVGLPGCVTPPMGYSDYTHFTVGSQETEDGLRIPVGTLVAGPRHANARDSFRAAQEHYDDVSARVAKVRAGEDEFGIWVAGWILPTAKPEALEIFMSQPVSGDWREIGGRLEMIAVCSVNAPGFPVTQARVAFSNDNQRTLIAAGFTPQTGDAPAPVTDDGSEARARWAWATAEERN